MEQTISILIFIAVIVGIVSEKVDRTAVALAGTVMLMLTHILDVEKAIEYVDFNTIGVLVGMMMFVSVVKNSGLFEYIAIKSAKIAKGNPWRIMVSFMILTAVLSAFLDNVTTVLLIGPMTITICEMLRINPTPMLMTQIFSSNIGGTATLIGDPPNIMIGSAANLDFTDFLVNTGSIVIVIMIIMIGVMRLLYGKNLGASEEAILDVMSLDENKAISDKPLLFKSIVVMGLIVAGFIFHGFLGVESSVVALTAATIMLIIGKQNVEMIIQSAEWATILFFMGLFIVVGGLDETGVISHFADVLVNLTDGNQMMTMLVLLWGSAILSSILDNIPFVATLIPLIIAMGNSGVDVVPFWWAISLGACLGGNGTLIGASANVVLSGIAQKRGYLITFKDYAKVGFPVMLLSVFIAMIYLFFRF